MSEGFVFVFGTFAKLLHGLKQKRAAREALSRHAVVFYLLLGKKKQETKTFWTEEAEHWAVNGERVLE